jgi:hypothetical protein
MSSESTPTEREERERLSELQEHLHERKGSWEGFMESAQYRTKAGGRSPRDPGMPRFPDRHFGDVFYGIFSNLSRRLLPRSYNKD